MFARYVALGAFALVLATVPASASHELMPRADCLIVQPETPGEPSTMPAPEAGWPWCVLPQHEDNAAGALPYLVQPYYGPLPAVDDAMGELAQRADL